MFFTVDFASLLTGYALAIATIYVTAVCSRRLQRGHPLAPTFKRSNKPEKSESGYRSRYGDDEL